LPIDEIGFHSGDIRNQFSIGIGIIPADVNGIFSKDTEDTLRLLIEDIRQQTGLPLKLERHFDGTQRKNCPLFYTPLSQVVSEDAGGHDTDGQTRWENLELILNDFDRTLTNTDVRRV
jgi:hypothetical protein